MLLPCNIQLKNDVKIVLSTCLRHSLDSLACHLIKYVSPYFLNITRQMIKKMIDHRLLYSLLYRSVLPTLHQLSVQFRLQQKHFQHQTKYEQYHKQTSPPIAKHKVICKSSFLTRMYKERTKEVIQQ